MYLGHDEDKVWRYTPRKIIAYLELAQKRMKRETAQQLSTVAMASRGDPKELQKQIKALSK